ncbi:MAG TPA: quercetin 2,3-dioxygenase [Blastocatellia bacterium]|jgi:redox-sensitive bicupin YhaK (pirin superfamily)|nr:quercetin 2,3-dioxygenase [Blastocatellia bacterium]HAF24800.1 quercetin 2,3-dioxygenase [Blastocatellia bacterium]
MITIRKAEERGHFDFGWLNTYHTFSFGDYYDPRHVHFRTLRVINEDFVKAGHGFPTHGHRDMEIITYILQGALEHRDSMGNGSIIRRGDAQRMSAGTGVTHSESNPLPDEDTHLLQIWILPGEQGIQPEYEEKRFSDDEKRNNLRLLVSPEGRAGSVTIHQDASIYASLLEVGHEVVHKTENGRHAWLQVAAGAVTLNDVTLKHGDGAAVSQEPSLRITAAESSEILLFDFA